MGTGLVGSGRHGSGRRASGLSDCAGLGRKDTKVQVQVGLKGGGDR